MKFKHYSEEPIAFTLRQAETGVSMSESVRKMGISEARFYWWNDKFKGLGVVEVRQLKQSESVVVRLKQLVADLILDKAMLQNAINQERTLTSPSAQPTTHLIPNRPLHTLTTSPPGTALPPSGSCA